MPPSGSPLQSATLVPTPKPFYCSYHTINNPEAERRTVINSWDPTPWSGQRRGLRGGTETGGRSVCRWGNVLASVSWQKFSACSFRPRYRISNVGSSFFISLRTLFGWVECHANPVLISQSHAHSLTLLFGPCCCIELVEQKLQWHMTKARHEIQLGKGLLKISQPSLKRIAFDILVLPFTAYLGIALISKHPTSSPPFPFLYPSLFISLSIFPFLLSQRSGSVSCDRNWIVLFCWTTKFLLIVFALITFKHVPLCASDSFICTLTCPWFVNGKDNILWMIYGWKSPAALIFCLVNKYTRCCPVYL